MNATFSLPFVDDLSVLTQQYRQQLELLAVEPRVKGRVDRHVMTAVILELTRGHFITLACLAKLVMRDPETLRGQYLTRMVRAGKLRIAFPRTPNDPRQAYTNAGESDKKPISSSP